VDFNLRFFGVDLLLFWRIKSYQNNTGLFISPSGISELSSTTNKTDAAERNISIGAEFLQDFLFLFTRFH
jgi:hypothetical protein